MAGEDPRYFQKIFVDENVGFAVFTTELIPSGTSICRYKRDCISLSKAREREREKGYNNNPSVGSYMFYGIDKCLDATSKSRYGDAIARYELCQMPLINPSR